MQYSGFILLPLMLGLAAPVGDDVGGPRAMSASRSDAARTVGPRGPAGDALAGLGPAPALSTPGLGKRAGPAAALPPFDLPPPGQVRIEQRMVIRIAPARPIRSLQPDSLVPAPAAEPRPIRLVERRMGRCIDADAIVGIRPRGDDRLLLYLDDRTMVSAELDGRCRGRMFYSGAYAERGTDGKICIARDRLQSRAGASCGIERFYRLVPAD